MSCRLPVPLAAPDADPRPASAFGADYNPEQWPREVWEEDVRPMREAGVNIVSLGDLLLGPYPAAPRTPGLRWLDEVMDLLHAGGIGSTWPPRPRPRRRG